MDISIKHSSINESTLVWAIICSILLHILFFVVVPNFKFDAVKKIPDVLKIEIVQPKKPEPVVIPEPPKPIEPIKETPKPEPIKPLPKDLPKPKPEPAPIKEAMPEPTHAEPPPPPNVITAVPKIDTAPPEIIVPPPPPEPPRNVGPSDDEIRSARSTYKSLLTKEIGKNQKYHPLALQRGLEGITYVAIEINASGKVVNVSLCKSSGYDILDNSALKAASALSTLPLPKYIEVFSIADDEQISCDENIAIQKDNYRIKSPITFKIKNKN